MNWRRNIYLKLIHAAHRVMCISRKAFNIVNIFLSSTHLSRLSLADIYLGRNFFLESGVQVDNHGQNLTVA